MARSRDVVVPSMDESSTVSVRQIDNGFIVTTSSCGPKGYSSNETFTPTRPSIGVVVAEGEEVGSRASPSRLRAAVTTLKRRRK